MRIFISPYSKTLRNGKINPKNYPYWKELVKLLKQKHVVTQIGAGSEKPLVEDTLFDTPLTELVEKIKKEMDLFISVDNFFPHLCHYYGKKGIVIWGPSDPEIFGYPENINIMKDKKYLRPNQFENWEQWKYKAEAFIKPELINSNINKLY